jgi:hypothetical protein
MQALRRMVLGSTMRMKLTRGDINVAQKLALPTFVRWLRAAQLPRARNVAKGSRVGRYREKNG